MPYAGKVPSYGSVVADLIPVLFVGPIPAENLFPFRIHVSNVILM
jgi:hypothetical protein